LRQLGGRLTPWYNDSSCGGRQSIPKSKLQPGAAPLTDKLAGKPGQPADRPLQEWVNWLNVALMIVSLAAAIAAPFHVFLLAYAVLGPLHYLTEISWLHDRDYFTRRRIPRRWWLALVSVTTLVLAYGYVSSDLLQRPVAPTFEIGLVYLVFGAGAVAVYARSGLRAIGVVLVLGIAIVLFSGLRTYAVAAFFLVTIIHVFAFTGAFILYGALKTRSRAAVLSLCVFAACAIAAATVRAPFAIPGDRVRQLYGGFEQLNLELLRLFGQPLNVYGSPAVAVMRVIAFAYLYHYLNWFSKTSIIRWHEVRSSRAVAILAIWVGGGLVYLHDFRIGFAVFYVLSMLHVLLEFPLNHQTFVFIWRSLRVDGPRTSAAQLGR
jgi:hypothetical protein